MTFIASEVSCVGNGACNNSENINMDTCSCCNGSNCPSGVVTCSDATFCSTTYMGKTCAEWGNPICNIELFLDNVGRNTFTGEPNYNDIFDKKSSSSSSEEEYEATLPIEDDDDNNALLFALLALLVFIPIMVFCYHNNRKNKNGMSSSEDNGDDANKHAYDTSSEASSGRE